MSRISMSAPPSRASTSSSATRGPLLAAFMSMTLMGITTVMTGALLPAILRDLRISPAQAGLLVSSPAVGYVVAAITAGALGDRWGYRRIWLLGVAMGLIALAGIAAAPGLVALLPAVAMLGLVGGFFDGSINPLIATLARGRSGGTLNRVHLFFGLGATLAPLLISLGLSLGLSWRWHYVLLTAYVLAVGLVILRATFPPWERPAQEPLPLRRLLGIRAIALPVFAMLIYGGVEASLFAWIALYLERVRAVPLAAASLGVSLFGGAMMAGRLVCGQVAERVGYQRLVVGSAALGGLFLAGMMLAPGSVGPWVAIGLAGLALAGIFATVMADVTQQAPGRAGMAAGLICSSSGLGKIILPWLVGQATQAATLSTALWIVIACALAMAALYRFR